MKSKKKNEMEKAQNTKGAAQELDMDALEDVSGGLFHLRPIPVTPLPRYPLPDDAFLLHKNAIRGRAQEK